MLCDVHQSIVFDVTSGAGRLEVGGLVNAAELQFHKMIDLKRDRQQRMAIEASPLLRTSDVELQFFGEVCS
jgi:hypothetical protein